jgi:hypothetical protein
MHIIVSLLVGGVVYVTGRQTAYVGLTLHNISIYPPESRGDFLSRETDVLCGEINLMLKYNACASSATTHI